MKTINKSLILLALVSAMSPTAFASGTHSGGHGHSEGGHGHDGGHAQSAVGGPGDVAKVAKTIHVDLLDSMRFKFAQDPELHRGDVVRFVVSNRGRIRHEFSIGNAAEQTAHRAQMRNMPNMVHDDPNAVTVEPGQSKELVWRFDGTDEVVFACNIPGHSEAGMVAKSTLH